MHKSFPILGFTQPYAEILNASLGLAHAPPSGTSQPADLTVEGDKIRSEPLVRLTKTTEPAQHETGVDLIGGGFGDTFLHIDLVTELGRPEQ